MRGTQPGDAPGTSGGPAAAGAARGAGEPAGTAKPAGTAGGAGGPSSTGEAGASGPELARAAIDAARAKRAAAPRPRRTSGTGSGGRLRGYSGPGPDPRDPQPFGALVDRLISARGWQRPTAEAGVFGDWPKAVGSEVAAHCRPVKLEQGELTVEAESTAWATQLRLLSGRLLAGIAAHVGHNVVTRLHIHGPARPDWGAGPRRVRGRGPRDTYG